MEKWYEKINDNNGIVISTRIRLARNISKLPFKNKMSEEQRIKLNNKVESVLKTANLGNNHFDFIHLSELSDVEKMSFVEKHLVSKNFVENAEDGFLILSQDNSISIMVNEEDHIRIQVLSSGLDLENAYKTCDLLDNLLNEQLNFAFSKRLGYLTACPTNLGTGLRASVMLHLPALEENKSIKQLIKTVERLGLTIRGTYGEGTQAVGSIYQLSNQVTLGLSEKTAIENLLNVTKQIIMAEKSARDNLLKSSVAFENEIYKSFGILKYSRLLSSEDFNTHISNLRIGISEEVIKDIGIDKINKLYNTAYAATLCVNDKKNYLPEERDFKRAELVREIFI